MKQNLSEGLVLKLMSSFKGCVCYNFASLFFKPIKESTYETRKNAFYFISKALFSKFRIF